MCWCLKLKWFRYWEFKEYESKILCWEASYVSCMITQLICLSFSDPCILTMNSCAGQSACTCQMKVLVPKLYVIGRFLSIWASHDAHWGYITVLQIDKSEVKLCCTSGNRPLDVIWNSWYPWRAKGFAVTQAFVFCDACSKCRGKSCPSKRYRHIGNLKLGVVCTCDGECKMQ